MDDTTLSEIIPKRDHSRMATIMNGVITWSSNNFVNINWNKTKEMLITTNKDLLCDVLSNNNGQVERVYSLKLLDITIDDR